MKTGSSFNQVLLSLLVSAVIGILFAMIIGLSALNVLDYGLPRQLSILALLSIGLGAVSYIVLIPSHNPIKILSTHSDPGAGLVIRRIFLAILFLFPFSLILYQQIVEFTQILRIRQSSDFIGWLPAAGDVRPIFIQALVFICFLILATFIAHRRPSARVFFENLPNAVYVLLIFLGSVAVRLPIILLINTQPISDFGIINQDALELAQGGRPSHMYVATHVAVTVIYGLVYRVFGPDLSVIKLFHAVTYGLSGVFLFAAGKTIFESKFWAGVAAILLIIWPSLVVYSNVLTPEHLFILIECALIFVALKLFENREEKESLTSGKRPHGFLIWSIVAGLLIGISGFFRPFGELFLVALVFTVLLYTKNLKRIAVSLLGMLIAFWVVRGIPTAIAVHYENPFGNIRPCNLLVGLNFEYAGQYNTEDVELCSKLRSEISDETAFTQKIIRVIRDRFQAQKDDLIPFVNQKFAILWSNSNGILFWAVQSAKDGDQQLILNSVRKINLTDFAIMFVVTIACLIGTVVAFFKDIKPAVFFCLLTFFGFNLMEIPFELQTRYRTVVMPILIFFACWTFAASSAWMATRKQTGMELPASRKANNL